MKKVGGRESFLDVNPLVSLHERLFPSALLSTSPHPSPLSLSSFPHSPCRKFVIYTGLQQTLVDYNLNGRCLLDNPLYKAPKPPCVSRCYDTEVKEYHPQDAPAMRNWSYSEKVR